MTGFRALAGALFSLLAAVLPGAAWAATTPIQIRFTAASFSHEADYNANDDHIFLGTRAGFDLLWRGRLIGSNQLLIDSGPTVLSAGGFTRNVNQTPSKNCTGNLRYNPFQEPTLSTTVGQVAGSPLLVELPNPAVSGHNGLTATLEDAGALGPCRLPRDIFQVVPPPTVLEWDPPFYFGDAAREPGQVEAFHRTRFQLPILTGFPDGVEFSRYRNVGGNPDPEVDGHVTSFVWFGRAVVSSNPPKKRPKAVDPFRLFGYGPVNPDAAQLPPAPPSPPSPTAEERRHIEKLVRRSIDEVKRQHGRTYFGPPIPWSDPVDGLLDFSGTAAGGRGARAAAKRLLTPIPHAVTEGDRGIRLRARLSRAGLRKLRHRGSLRVKLTARFRPLAGKPVKVSRVVRLR